MPEALELHEEHVMIVDLERNDLSRVCVPRSIRWPELMDTRPLAGVAHMVSTVEGEPRAGVRLAELLAATMGALGRVRGNGDLELALTIRTFAIAEETIHLWVGGGIVWGSHPAAEVEESRANARPLLDALGTPLPQPLLAHKGRA